MIKKFKIALNNFCTFIHFIHCKNILINHELCIVLQKIAYYIGINFVVLYNYSLNVYYDAFNNSFIEHKNNPLLVKQPWDIQFVMIYHYN